MCTVYVLYVTLPRRLASYVPGCTSPALCAHRARTMVVDTMQLAPDFSNQEAALDATRRVAVEFGTAEVGNSS
ncbi:predicted protein [Plenodomus lingam JN3]|uniref:Predicted protein n=1 Tax=Leptosphaeria maculans (strain JN3 / isolate v23.1.3 / race Av1-4-5-6-7-8) TaxID=985895 RepID=E5R4H6_LEPMJ|nr:predicted protein [Plenodomus lingam JN3]CBX91944.1 predicted protein [Plenodomus lingam JN3]